MKKLNLTVKITAAILAILLPFLPLALIAFVLPGQYGHTFVGILDEKLDRLESIEGEKIVVVGGSSVAFGLDSKLFEEKTGTPVVNFGLYAALGTKLMLDLSLPNIKAGDTVVIAPEMDAQTLSLYFNAGTTLRALDGNLSYIFDIPSEHYSSLLGQSFDFALEKLEYMIDGAPTASGVYTSDSFNEYGDVVYPRPDNKMQGGVNENEMITLDESIVSADFLEYLNAYITECEARGASVYFSFCPMNSLAFESADYLTEAREFSDYLSSVIECELISDVSDYIMDSAYFYDTNFHLNDTGATRRTILLANDILKARGEDYEENPELPTVPGTEPELPPVTCTHRDADDDLKCDYCGTKFTDGKEPTADEPTTDDPEIPEDSPPTTDEPTTDDPTTDDPEDSPPTTDDPATDDPTTDDPTTDDPTVDDPATDDPTTDDPTTDDPTVDEPECPHDDYDEDGICDWCLECIAHADTDRDHRCDICFADYTADCTKHTDDDRDHLCDYCSEECTVTCVDHIFELGTGNCDYCGLPMPTDENAVHFEYELARDGTYAIVSVREESKSLTELTIPLWYQGVRVTQVGADAFVGSAVNKLTVTADTSLRIFKDGAFASASNLSELVMLYPYAEELLPPRNFVGVDSDFKVYVTSDSSYVYDYYWSERGLDFEFID